MFEAEVPCIYSLLDMVDDRTAAEATFTGNRCVGRKATRPVHCHVATDGEANKFGRRLHLAFQDGLLPGEEGAHAAIPSSHAKSRNSYFVKRKLEVPDMGTKELIDHMAGAAHQEAVNWLVSVKERAAKLESKQSETSGVQLTYADGLKTAADFVRAHIIAQAAHGPRGSPQ